MSKKKAKPAAAKSKPAKTGRAARSAAPADVFRLKITLTGIRPLIWRRVETKDCTLAELHDIIQLSMGWLDGHLHLFEIGDEQLGLPEQWKDGLGGDEEVLDSRKVRLSRLVQTGRTRFRYVYDMGDDWNHSIVIEKTVPAEADAHYPRCTGGELACPPEDCGGVWGYADLLEALQGPPSERREELLEWLDREFDPEAFSPDEVNAALVELC